MMMLMAINNNVIDAVDDYDYGPQTKQAKTKDLVGFAGHGVVGC